MIWLSKLSTYFKPNNVSDSLHMPRTLDGFFREELSPATNGYVW